MKLAEFLATTTQAAVAREMGVTPGMVSHWVTDRRGIAAEWVLKLCALSDWRMTPHEVRPDIYPNPSDGLPASRSTAEAA